MDSIERRMDTPGMVKTRFKQPAWRPTFLRAWREHRGYSQERAASIIEMDRSNLSRVERGEIPYSQALLEAAAKAYRCEPQDLLMRNPKIKDAVWTVSDNLKKADPETQEAIAKATPDELRTALELIQTAKRTGTTG